MTIIEKLTEDILVDDYFKIIFNKCLLLTAKDNLNAESQDDILSYKELKDACRFADILSHSKNSEARNKSYQIITYLNAQYSGDKIYQTASKAVYSQLGNFPAFNYLININSNDVSLPLENEIRIEAKKLVQKVPDSIDLVFTDDQYRLFSKISNTTKFSFSGPTSMGKSFIIKAFIKKAMRNSPPENLVIIVPTRALINQFTIDLKGEIRELSEQFNYRILTNSNVSDFVEEEHHNYILILTPERLISYLSQDTNPPIGFIFVDEAHKLANHKDSRSVTTYTAIENTIKKYGNIKLYFSSPNVSNPEIFLQLFNKNGADTTYRTDESPVSQNLFFIDIQHKKVELIQNSTTISIEAPRIFEGIETIPDLVHKLGFGKTNLIYCNSKSKTIQEARSFCQGNADVQLSEPLRKAIRQVEGYIHPDYYLAEFLKHKVAFHYGKLPQLIRNLVEDLYKNEEVQNVFCTSTLLEGVNMPTQNIFIIANKNGLKKLSPIDFWNLAGRAGRLSKELSGNIFCVQHENCDWTDKAIMRRTKIELEPTVSNKIDKNIRKIEKLLKDQDISGPEEEKSILKYIANIISVDTLELQSEYKSPLINQLIEKHKEELIDLVQNKMGDYEIPTNILNSNQSINLKVQNKVYQKISRLNAKGARITLPMSSSINYATCLEVLKVMYRLYEWKDAEKKLNNENSLSYYAMIMNKWINGINLSLMIKQSIEYYEENNCSIQLNYIDYVPFEAGNKVHINIVIENLIDDIEYVLRFLFEKYFNHYYQVIKNILGEELAGENWASLLEYGTQNRIAIALQNIGLSRHTALKIYEKCRTNALTIQDGKLVRVDKAMVLTMFRATSIEYDEIVRIL